MTDQEFDDLKEGYIENIKKYMQQAGGLFPHISIFADHKDKSDNKHAIIHVPIPEKMMDSESGKDKFVDEVLPELAEVVNKKFHVKGIAWASEAWMRTADKDQADLGNWKSLPKKEVLIVTIETETKNLAAIYEMHRTGLKVNDEGEMIDSIDLVELEGISVPAPDSGKSLEGRFTGLYKKFKAHC